MNKNKKRLSKLLIPMLAVSGINANAMENVNVRRNKSLNNVKINIRKKMNSEPFKKGVLIKNIKFKKKKQQYLIQYGGKALDDFNDKYQILPTSKYREVIKTHNLEGLVFGEAAGHGGSVSQCRNKKTGDVLSVKYTPNIKTTGVETLNNAEQHNEDLKNEQAFYEDYKRYWQTKPWALKYYDFFPDEDGAYAVTEWLEGEELLKYLNHLKIQVTNLPQRLHLFADVAEQYNQIVDDLRSHNKENRDLHEKNLMIIEHPTNKNKKLLKVVDNGWYTDEKPKFENHSAKVLIRFFRQITTPKELYCLANSRKPNERKLFSIIAEALYSLNAKINPQGYQILTDYYDNPYTSEDRHEFVNYLKEI